MTTTAVEVERRPVTRYNPATETFDEVDGALETREEREARLRGLAGDPDTPPCDMKMVARILGITHQRVRFLHSQREDAEAILADQAASATERAQAQEFLLDAIPHTPHRVGRQPVWKDPWRIYDFGRRNRQLDGWYEPKRKPPGGPPGTAGVLSRQPTMTTRVPQLRRRLDADGSLDRLSAKLRERVAGEAYGYYTELRAGRVKAARARAATIAAIAEKYADRGVSAAVVEYLLLDHLLQVRART